MPLFQFRYSILWVAMAMCGSPAHADLYGFVEGNRVSVIYSDRQPDDARYRLYRNDPPGQFKVLPADRASGIGLAPSRYRAMILAAANETQVDPALIHAVISVESGYNPSARSPAGALGLMQLMPATAKRYGVKNRLDPAQNIRGGARYLRDLKILFGNKLPLVLAAYNAGEGAVIRHGRRIPPFRETAAYVPKVLSFYRAPQ